MERQEKIDKLICVLNANLDKVTVDGTAIHFNVFQNGFNNRIEFFKSTRSVPAVTETRYYFGLIPIKRTLKKEQQVPTSQIYSHIDGYVFNEYVDLEIFNELHKRAIEARDETFINKLNIFIDGEKK